MLLLVGWLACSLPKRERKSEHRENSWNHKVNTRQTTNLFFSVLLVFNQLACTRSYRNILTVFYFYF